MNETSATATTSPTLLRALGPGAAVAVVVGNTIGSGIFFKPGTIAADAGDFRLILAAWLIGGAVCACGALAVAELAAMLPRAGGLYVYLREAYGRPAAFLFGWSEFLFARPGSVGALSVAFLGAAWGLGGSTSPLLLWLEVAGALVLIAALSAVNVVGVVWGGRVQSATTVLKAGAVAVLATAPWLLWLAGQPVLDIGNFATRFTSTAQPAGLMERAALVLLAVLWAYDGWHGLAPMAEEVREPDRNLPRALLGGIAVLVALYVGANVAYHAVLPMGELAAGGEQATAHVAQRVLGPLGAAGLSAVILVSTFGAINSNMLLGPRVSFAMGRDGLFFRGLGGVQATFRTPASAILAQGAMAALLVLAAATSKWALADVNVAHIEPAMWRTTVETLQRQSIFTLLTNLVVFSAGVFYALAVLAVIVLRWRRPDLPRPYRTWGYPVTPLLFLAFYAWFLWRVYAARPLEANLGLAAMAAGLPLYWLFVRRRATS
jgi:APA family basic amino acid/polyamine antiporter